MPVYPEQTVVPIYIARRDNPPIPIQFAGTGFLIAPRLLVTCWHCVGADLPTDQGYVGLFEDVVRHVEWLEDISRDVNGSDLATANVRAEPGTRFQLARDRALQGADVTAFGYPFSGQKEIKPGVTAAKVERRLFKGYVMRTFKHSSSSQPETLAYELSFPAPAGLSGAPVIELGTPRVIGVIFGNSDVATIEHFAQVDSEGNRTPELQRIVSFGLAIHTNTLLKLAGRATNSKALAEIIS
jgi:hypothetical protein